MQHVRRHADCRARGDGPVLVLQRAIRGNARAAMAKSIRQTKTLFDYRGKVRKAFEMRQRGRWLRSVWHGFLELGLQSVQDARVGEDEVGCRAEDVGGRDDAGADDHNAFVDEASERALRGGDIAIVEIVEDGGGGRG